MYEQLQQMAQKFFSSGRHWHGLWSIGIFKIYGQDRIAEMEKQRKKRKIEKICVYIVTCMHL